MPKITPQTTLSQWLAWIANNHTQAIDLGLTRIQACAQQLNLFQKKLAKKIVTVAGTNGKGTCIYTIESILVKSGLTVASYISPHLYEFNERIRINGNNISNKDLCNIFYQIYHQVDTTTLTFFEYITIAALLYFSTKTIDVLLLEIGLGGNFDAVNIIPTDIAVITSIGLDHTERLGKTLDEISKAKA